MNEELQNFGKDKLKEGLEKLTNAEQHMFKRMYAKGNLEKDIDTVVDDMDEECISRAMVQVKRSLELKVVNKP